MALKCKAVGFILVVLLTFIVLLAEASIHLLNWWPPGKTFGLFTSLEPDIWNTYDLPAVNTQWLFYIWIVVYMLQIIWVGYGFQLVCRGNFFGDVYSKFSVLPVHCFALFSLAVVGNFGWLYLWNSKFEYFRFAPICLSVSCLLAYGTLAMAGMSTTKHASMLRKAKSVGLVWENRWIVHNAMAAYASWLTIILMYNIAVLIHSYDLLSKGTESYIFAGVLIGYLILYLILDFFLCLDYFLSVLTPYFLCTVTFASVLVKNLDKLDYHFIITTVFGGFALVMLIVKMCIICCNNNSSPDKEEENKETARRFGQFRMELRSLDSETDDL